MRRITLPAVCFSLLLYFCCISTASGAVNLRDVVTFGDSLTDNDLLSFYSGSPQDMYGKDPMHAAFNKASRAGTELWKYAVAGSHSDDLALQVDAYESARLAGLQDKATLFSIEIGGNDILNNISRLAAFPPGARNSVDGITDSIITNIRHSWRVLKASHPNAGFVIWTVPDVTMTPDQWAQLSDTQARNVRAHIQRANKSIRNLGKHSSVIVLDLYQILRQYVADPPVYLGHQIIPPPAYGDYDDFFADKIHPTAASNAMLANRIISLMNSKWKDSIPLYTNRQLARMARIPF